MKLKEIIIEQLESYGFDGLANNECGCGIDDLAPCGSINHECKAARKVKLPNGNIEYIATTKTNGWEIFWDWDFWVVRPEGDRDYNSNMRFCFVKKESALDFMSWNKKHI